MKEYSYFFALTIRGEGLKTIAHHRSPVLRSFAHSSPQIEAAPNLNTHIMCHFDDKTNMRLKALQSVKYQTPDHHGYDFLRWT